MNLMEKKSRMLHIRCLQMRSRVSSFVCRRLHPSLLLSTPNPPSALLSSRFPLSTVHLVQPGLLPKSVRRLMQRLSVPRVVDDASELSRAEMAEGVWPLTAETRARRPEEN